MNLQANERETYETIWSFDQYAERSPGERYVPTFMEMAGLSIGGDPSGEWGLHGRFTVLDAGCGSGKGAAALKAKGFDVRMCDITPNGLVPEANGIPFRQVCLWQDLHSQLGYNIGGKFDYVYCCDVLEHVPTPFTMLTISRLLEVTRFGLFLSIDLELDQYGALIGRHLHQTVQGFTDWRDQIGELGTVVECRDLVKAGLYWVTP